MVYKNQYGSATLTPVGPTIHVSNAVGSDVIDEPVRGRSHWRTSGHVGADGARWPVPARHGTPGRPSCCLGLANEASVLSNRLLTRQKA